MKLSVVVPVFNEEKTIKKILEKVLSEKTPKEVIVVDDGSCDKTKEILKDIKDERVKIIFHEQNKGKGAAVRTGIKNAEGDFLIIQDADLEYDPECYQKLVNIVSKDIKVVYGTRLKNLKFRLFGKNKTPMPLHFAANRFLTLLTNFLYGSKITDMETCYKLMAKEVYQSLELVSDKFEIEPEITAKILKKGFKIIEMPIVFKPRTYKQGKKIKTKDAFAAVWSLVKYRIVNK
ncbi:glycosyltransferase family 2 protein [Candidatus Microgenomates bacterium]|jgi:glycosyltransferase involved in cell wall biosynthesis|nr:MAG: glycosyltransferase family 2 protein [Candidatus Microgenomates bacterium]